MASPGVPTPDGDDPVEVQHWRAWELHVEGRSLAYIGEALRISKTSAHRYVAAGRDLASQLDYLDRTRERETGAAVMALVRSWMVDAVESGNADPVAAGMVVIKAEERRAKLLGLDAPARVEVNAGGLPPTVPGEVVDAVNAYRQGRAQGEIGQ